MKALLRGFFAALLALAFAGTAHARDLTGVWTGTYVCAQGVTGLELTVTAQGSRLAAVFRFGETPDNPGVPDGAFEMSGHHNRNTDAVALDAGAWLEKPDDYEIVHLRGAARTENGIDVIEGDVWFPASPGACSVFRVERRPAFTS